MRGGGAAAVALGWAAIALAGCGVGSPKAVPKTPDQLACADPAAESRVNIRAVVAREGSERFPGADVLVDSYGRPVTVRHKIEVSGRHITNVAPAFQGAQTGISFLFDHEGAQQLAAATGTGHRGERMALVVDGALIAAPEVEGSIYAGAMQLTAGLPVKANEQLAERIRVAALGCVAPRRPAAPAAP